MREVRAGWSKGCVLVCTHERDPASGRGFCGREAGSELRRWLKDRIKARGLKARILAAKTSCLGICPKGPEGTVAILPDPASGRARRVLLVDQQGDREALWATIEDMLVEGTS